MKICPDCKTEHPYDFEICIYCGEKLVDPIKLYSKKEILINYLNSKTSNDEIIDKLSFLINNDKINDESAIDYHLKLEIERIEEKIKQSYNIKLNKYEKLNSNYKSPEIEVFISSSKYSNIFYLHNYIPKWIFDAYEKNNIPFTEEVGENIKISKKILDYKDGLDENKVFYKEFLLATIYLINTYFKDKKDIVLVSCPSSEKDKLPQTKETIDFIEKMYNEEEIQLKYDCSKKIYNFSDNLLIRYKTVEKSHYKDSNRSIKKHLNSISCVENDILEKDCGFILFDDITTSGNTIEACRQILEKNGIKSSDIIGIALGFTVRSKELPLVGGIRVLSKELIIQY